MALDERVLSKEQFTEMASANENLSPYSSSADFTEAPIFYHNDYDWQQAQLHQQQTLQHHAHMIESERHFYPGYPDENEPGGHAYTTYGHQPGSHTDLYPPVHGLWPTDSSGEPLPPGHISQHHLFFSGLDIGQQSLSQQSDGSLNNNGKPKRKRVQSHTQRKAANVRERRRMFHLNEAFDELRKRLPAFNYEKRLSRIETLRLAMTYISFMKEVSVGRDPKCVKLKPHGADLSPLPGSSGSLLASPHPSYISSDNNDDCAANEDSDCSNDELSNHSGGN